VLLSSATVLPDTLAGTALREVDAATGRVHFGSVTKLEAGRVPLLFFSTYTRNMYRYRYKCRVRHRHRYRYPLAMM
jgi:hypothetical protein